MTADNKKIEDMNADELMTAIDQNAIEVDRLINEGEQIATDLNKTLTAYDASLEDFRKEIDKIAEEEQ